MPRKKMTPWLNPSYTGKPGTKRKPTTSTIAKKALRMAKINTQQDSTPHSRVSIVLVPSAFVDLLVPAAPNSFPGRCKLTSLVGNFFVRQNIDSVGFDEWRVDILLDRQPARLQINPNNVYLSAGAPGTEAITAIINPAAMKRYKILYSRSGVFFHETYATATYHVNIPIGLIQETATGNFDQDGVTKNAIYVVAWSQTDALDDPPNITYDFGLYSITS